MNQTAILNQPARIQPRASSLERTAPTAAAEGPAPAPCDPRIQALVVPVWSDLMEMELTPAARQVAWTIVCWSLKLGRVATRPFTIQDLERRTGVGHANVVRAMKDLKGFAMLRRCGDGWQLVPQSKGHRWGGRRRLVDESQAATAARIDAAQGCAVEAQEFPSMEEPRLDVALGEVAVAEAAGAPPICGPARPMGEGARGTGEGAKNFLAFSGIESKRFEPPAPSIKFSSPSPSPVTLIDNSLLYKGGDGIKSIPSQNPTGAGYEPEAGMDGEDYVDRMSTDERTLLKRLAWAVGTEGRDGMKKKGGMWTNFIRGSLAEDDPTTAEAVRFALNEFRVRRVEGRPVRSAGGFLYGHAMAYAAEHGWTFEYGADSLGRWVRCEKFNWWKHRNAAGKRHGKTASSGA